MVSAENADSGIDESATFANGNVLWLCARAVLCVGVAERILLCIWLSGGKDMICTKCGDKVAENAVFCTKCGRKIERMQCPHCGTVMEENAVFCSECGKEIGEKSSWENLMDKKVIAVEVQAKETEDSIDKEEEGETDFSEDIMNMNLFEKIAVYQRKGLDHTVEYFQFLEIKKLTYFFGN